MQTWEARIKNSDKTPTISCLRFEEDERFIVWGKKLFLFKMFLCTLRLEFWLPQPNLADRKLKTFAKCPKVKKRLYYHWNYFSSICFFLGHVEWVSTTPATQFWREVKIFSPNVRMYLKINFVSKNIPVHNVPIDM